MVAENNQELARRVHSVKRIKREKTRAKPYGAGYRVEVVVARMVNQFAH